MNFQRNKVNQAVVSVIAGMTASAAVADQGVIEEVVVTATKRAEPMQSIPVSIQAMQGDDIDELGVDNFEEYVQYLPNVVFSGRGPGQAELYIRGTATDQSAITVSSVQGSAPAVAFYQDEQPVSFGGQNLDVYSTDLERIEVLPGPQGTLFGASSQTGTVRLITNKPNHDQFEAGFQTKMASTRGGDASHAIEAFMNMPLTDKLAVRVAAYNDRAGGWIDNTLGSYRTDIEVINRNNISSAAHICTGRAEVDSAIWDAANPNPAVGKQQATNCVPGQAAVVQSANNSGLVEDNFNDVSYAGARLGVSYLINDDWEALVQHTTQTLETEGVFDYDPALGAGEDTVNIYAPAENQDEFGLTTWTLKGRLAELDVVYTGGYLDREVFFIQDYTGYTNGGGYQAYYMCTGGYSDYSECFDPTKQWVGDISNERLTHEVRVNWDPTDRLKVTTGVFIDAQETNSEGQFQYPGAVSAGFNVSSAPGTITSDVLPLQADLSNLTSVVDGVNDPFGRGPNTLFINDFTREEDQIAFFGEFSFDITDDVSVSIGARHYDIDYEFTGSTGSSFDCKGEGYTCDGQGSDNRVSERLEALGRYAGSRDIADLEAFYGEVTSENTTPTIIADGVADGSFYLSGIDADGVINQSDTIYRGTINWDVTDDVMVFAAYSEGFRPQTANRNAGAPSANQDGPYEGYLVPAIATTDELQNFEIGIKSQFFGDTLQINATAYTSEVTDLQVSRFDPSNVAFLVFMENAGDAEVDGLDLDFTWLPTANLTLSGGASVVNNELTRINSQLDEIVVPVGSRLPWTPEFRANLRARYDFRLESMQADAYVRGGIIYTGDSLSGTACNAYLVEDVTRQVYGQGSGLKIQEEGGFCGQPLSGDDLASVVDKSSLALDGSDQRFKAARYVQRSYTLVNVAAGMERDSWSAELYVNNVFDKSAETQINTADYTPSVSTNRPRTVGLRLGYRFE